MDPATFELFVDASIAKYRQQREGRYRSFAMDTPKNPLRLLYSSEVLAHSDMLKGVPVEESDLKSPFVTAKSHATVLETPLLLLHKKLRINALPTKSKTDKSVVLEDVAAGAEQQDDELWSSSGIYTETDEVELNDSLWDSSDVDLDSSAEGASTADTNKYYMLLQQEISTKRNRHRRRTRMKRFRSEASPNPKHQPLHRTLQPKQLILKIARSGQTFKAISPVPSAVDTLYRASPRASFVSDVSAVGYILQSIDRRVDGAELLNGIDSGDGDMEDNVEEADESTIDRLRSLLT